MPAPTATFGLDNTWVRKAGQPVNMGITFSEAVTGFDKADLSFAHGTFSDPVDLNGDGITWTMTLTLNDGVDRTADTISVNLSGVTSVSDSAAGVGSVSSDYLSFDTKPATATITVANTALQPGGTSLVTFKFSEFANNFDANDVSASNGTLTEFTSLGDGVTWTAKLTTDGGAPNTPHVITLNNTDFNDDVGNVGTGTTTSNSYVIDTASPTVTNIVVADTALKAGENSLVTFTFSEAVTGFTTDDLTIANGALTNLAATGDPKVWTATFTPTADVSDTTNVITLNMNGATGVTDVAGNAGMGARDSNNYGIDTARPTVNIFVADNALSVGETSLVTFTFSEAVTGFTNADLAVANGTLSAVTPGMDGGITWTATLTPNDNVPDTTNLITLANTGVSDLAGNAGTGTTDSNNYEVNTVRPTAIIAVADTALIIGETSEVTITFTEAVTGFTLADLTAPNGTLSSLSTGDNITWTATFTPNGNITDTTNLITLDNSGVQAVASGNVGAGSSVSNNYAVDTTRPMVVITMDDDNLTIGEKAMVTFTFSEAVTGFTNADLTIEGGTLTGVGSSDGGVSWTAEFTPTAPMQDASNVITLNMAGVSDLADLTGNAGSGWNESDNYAIDTVRPTVTSFVVADTSLTAGETSLVTITFSEAITGFTSDDLAVANGTLSAVTPGMDGGITWTAILTPNANVSDTTNVITLANAGVSDLAGNAGASATSDNYAINTAPPTASIVVADNALQIGDTPQVTITFSEAVSGFTNADLTIANGSLTTVNTTDGGITYTATFTPDENITDATNLITLDNSGVQSAASGNLGAGTSDSNNYAIDTARPTVVITMSGDNKLMISETATVTFTFSEAVENFSNADLTIANGTLGAVSSSDGGKVWTATLAPTASVQDSTNVITLDLTGLNDLAGNVGTGTKDSANYVVDGVRPTVTIDVADTALMAGETSLVTFTFSEAVEGFDNSDINIPNGTLSAVSSGDGNVTYTATFTPTSNVSDTTNLITVNNSGVTDAAAGNAGIGTTDSDNYAINTVRPTVTIDVDEPALTIGQTSEVTFTFSEAVNGFTLSDLDVANGALSNLTATSDPKVFTATLTPDANVPADATNVITLKDASVSNLAGNQNLATDSDNYAIDTAAPTVTIAVDEDKLAIGETAEVTFTFSEAVSGFTLDDLSSENGELSDLDTDDNVTWTAIFTPDADINEAGNFISLKDASVTDDAGNANAGVTNSNAYELDAARPTATITLANTALVTGQSTAVTFKFSEAVTGFANADLTAIEGGTLSTVNTTDGGVTWTATFTAGATTDATNVISFNTTGVTDLAGNAGTGTTTSDNYTISPYVPPVQPEPTTPTPTPGDDVITLPATGGTISAGEGADSVAGVAGDDIINGNVGDDSVSGGGGADIVRGGQGADFVQGNTGDDQIFGDIGGDTVHGGQGSDFVQGNAGDDYVSGDLGNDIVLGGQGDDVVMGGAGDDIVSGDLGNDILTGGTGADLFNFSGGAGHDVVTDFSRAEGDHIRISPSDAANFSALSSHITSQGADTLITLGAQTVVLVGVSAGSLTAADFMFG